VWCSYTRTDVVGFITVNTVKINIMKLPFVNTWFYVSVSLKVTFCVFLLLDLYFVMNPFSVRIEALFCKKFMINR